MASTTEVSDIAELVQGEIPVEVYLRTLDYEPDCEYVDGWIEERPAGEWNHSSWQSALQQWFAQHTTEWKIRVRPSLRLRVNESRYRVPDVVVFGVSVSAAADAWLCLLCRLGQGGRVSG